MLKSKATTNEDSEEEKDNAAKVTGRRISLPLTQVDEDRNSKVYCKYYSICKK